MILTREYELGFFGMIWAREQGPAYIGWWDEREPSDQTDLKQRMDAILEAVEDHRAKSTNKWARPRSADLALCQVGPAFGGMPSHIF
jgi:hypothetical protein